MRCITVSRLKKQRINDYSHGRALVGRFLISLSTGQQRGALHHSIAAEETAD
ncbi:hypothetical protein K8R78_02855 [bacterium]|nr:hypothetical protein [bacterium]